MVELLDMTVLVTELLNVTIYVFVLREVAGKLLDMTILVVVTAVVVTVLVHRKMLSVIWKTTE